MFFRSVLFCLSLLALPCRAVITTGPKEPYVCHFWEGLLEHRVLILIDPVLGPAPQITKFGKKISPPHPIDHAGVYEYPSFKLIYRLDGWSHFEEPCIGDQEMRFLLREVWDPPVGGKILPPGKTPGQFPPGLALYDGGKLVRYFPPEDIYRKYRDEACFHFDTVFSYSSYFPRFDPGRAAWRIETLWRGPALLNGFPECYKESMIIDARTGDMLDFSSVDWLQRGAWTLVTAVAVGIIFWKRRKSRIMSEAALPRA